MTAQEAQPQTEHVQVHTQSTRLSKWADDIRAIKETKLTPAHKRGAFSHLQAFVQKYSLLYSHLSVNIINSG